MTIFADDRNKLSVPFVRPEDDSIFKNLRTTSMVPGNELKATASPFTPKDRAEQLLIGSSECTVERRSSDKDDNNPDDSSPPAQKSAPIGARSTPKLNGTGRGPGPEQFSESAQHAEGEGPKDSTEASDPPTAEVLSTSGSSRRGSTGAPWGFWRQGVPSGSESGRETNDSTSSSYHKAPRTAKNMKILKPSKPASTPYRTSSSVRTGASYEPAPQRSMSDLRRKSQPNGTDGASEVAPPTRWEGKRIVSDEHKAADGTGKIATTRPRSSNPIGGASAFAWMNSKPPTSIPSAAD